MTKKVEALRKRWVYMETRQATPLLLIPYAPTVKISGLEQAKISSKELTPLMERMKILREWGFTGKMVTNESIR